MLYMGWAGFEDFEKRQNQLLEKIAEVNIEHISVVYQFSRKHCVERGRLHGGKRWVESESPPNDIVDPEELTRFVDWAVETFPSRYTALFVKDHGQGPSDGAPKDLAAFFKVIPHTVLVASGIFLDPSTHRLMAMPVFRRAIERTRSGRVDVLGLDACRVGSVEVAYELRDVATFLIASEMTVLTTGWGYPQVVQYLSQQNDLATPRELARKVVEVSPDFKLTAFELAWMPVLAKALDQLGDELIQRKDDVLNWVRSQFPQVLTDGVHLDLLVKSLRAADLCNASLATAADRVRLKTNGFAGQPRPDIGLYFPTTKGSTSIASYGSCQFAVDTSWAEFLGVLNHWLLTPPAS